MTAGLVTTDLGRAVDAIALGGLVAIPTETVYGLAASAVDVVAISRIYEVKGRPLGHPLIVHLADPEQLTEWVGPGLSPAALRLADTAWPGPLTIIVPRGDRLPPEVAGGLDTVGVRVPAHPLARELIARAGVPLAAPSANRFGSVSPTTAQHVLDDLGDRLDPSRDVILDGGPCPVGVESTIVDTTSDPPQILRPGGIPDEDVDALLADVAELAPASGPARASGMLPSHYAPDASVELVDSTDEGRRRVAELGTSARLLDRTTDPAAYARHLYDDLRRADRDGAEVVVAVLPPPRGLGHAVRDRLRKAAAPRSS